MRIAFRPLFSFLLTLALPAAADPLLLQVAQVKALGIDVQTVGNSQLRSRSLPARVVVPTAQMHVVTAPLGGVVASLAVAPGDHVRRGQRLAQIASREVLELQRDAVQAGSQSALLQQTLQRDEQLYAEGLIAEARLQATRAAALQATAQASERNLGLALAGATAGRIAPTLSLTSPIDGVVLEQNVQTGQRLDIATPVYRIARLSPLWLEIQVPLAEAAMLQAGQRVRVADSDLSGKLIAVGRAVDAASQSILLRAEIRNGAERLTPGQMLAVELPDSNSAPSGERLPANALVRDQGKTLAFVLSASDAQSRQFAVREVRVLAQGGDSVTVDGLKAGEKVVIRGASALKAMLTGVGRE